MQKGLLGGKVQHTSTTAPRYLSGEGKTDELSVREEEGSAVVMVVEGKREYTRLGSDWQVRDRGGGYIDRT
jgi:hypothetical protein